MKERASRFSRPFEQGEDARFFDDLSIELDATEPDAREHARLLWQQDMVARAEVVLRDAFDAGPRSGMQRYKAQAGALTRFHAGLRGRKPALAKLAEYLAQERLSRAPARTETV